MLELTWLGHATVVLDLGGVRLVTDPLLRRHTSGLVRDSAPDPVAWRGSDLVLLSHLHHDHADVGSLRRLEGVPVASGAANARWAARYTGNPRALQPGRWHEVPSAAGGVQVRLVRADHGHRPMLHRPNDSHGFLLRTDDLVVWFAGDTDLHDDMGGLADVAGRPIDLALVPVGGWGPRLSGGHLGPGEAAEACRRVGAAHAVPIHYGTLHPVLWPARARAWMTAPLPQFAAALAATSPGTRLHPLRVGATARISPTMPTSTTV